MMRATALVILGVTLVRAQDDIINGSEESDDLRGGIGSDTMLGNLGNDTMLGQSGEDIMKGGPGDDRLSGGNGEDTIRGDGGNDVVASGTGDDVLQGGPGQDFLIGGPGDDLLLGGPANDTLLGGVGNDTLSGEGGRDVFFGGPGPDILQGQPGLDTCVLNPSDDDCVTINFGTTCDVNTCLPSSAPILRADPAVEAVGPSILLPSVEASTCAALPAGSLVRTFVAPNTAGDGDTLGVTISNIMGNFTGAGVTFSTSSCCPSTCEDVILFADDDDDGDAQDVSFNIPVDDVNGGNVYIFVSYPRGNKDLTFTIETGDEIVAPAIVPGTLRRSLTKKAQDKKNAQDKNRSHNEFHKEAKFVKHNKEQSAFIVEQCAAVNATCDPNLATRFASSLQLQKVNTKRAKTQTKNAPYVARISPTLSPEVQASVKIAMGPDFEELEKDHNPVAVGPNGAIYIGGAGDDILRGKGGNDRMAGQDGDDTMIGAQDNDLLIGGEDDDLLIGGSGDDIVQGNAGNDTALGGPGNDTMIGGPGDDILRGGADADILAGAVGNDTLRGNAGNDILDGGEGADHIFGGADKDIMFGDDGIDECLLQPADAFLIDFDSTCDDDLCAPFTEPLDNDGTEQIGEVFVATQPSVRFECDNMANDTSVEGAQVFAIDTSAFVPPVQVQIDVSAAQFEGTIALSDSCCAQTCSATAPLVNGAAVLTQVFIQTPAPATIYAFVTSFNQTRGTFSIAASQGTGVEIPL